MAIDSPLPEGRRRPQRAWLTAVSRAVVLARALSTSTTPRDPPRERGADARTPSGASLRQLAETFPKPNPWMQASCIHFGERYIRATATSTLRKPLVRTRLVDSGRVTTPKHHASRACLRARCFLRLFSFTGRRVVVPNSSMYADGIGAGSRPEILYGLRRRLAELSPCLPSGGARLRPCQAAGGDVCRPRRRFAAD